MVAPEIRARDYSEEEVERIFWHLIRVQPAAWEALRKQENGDMILFGDDSRSRVKQALNGGEAIAGKKQSRGQFAPSVSNPPEDAPGFGSSHMKSGRAFMPGNINHFHSGPRNDL